MQGTAWNPETTLTKIGPWKIKTRVIWVPAVSYMSHTFVEAEETHDKARSV